MTHAVKALNCEGTQAPIFPTYAAREEKTNWKMYVFKSQMIFTYLGQTVIVCESST